ncbi:MAG: regulatory protein RecX [Saprospiraceae bacterium]|jgi:regulatory protein
MQKYCAYQDRCHAEVRRKLIDLGVYGDDLEGVITDLISDNFLNEERFARSFARGKFRMKSWGKVRILGELRARQISEYCKRKALEEIPDDEYFATANRLILQKMGAEAEEDPFKRKAKVAAYAIRRGFESDLVWRILNTQEE